MNERTILIADKSRKARQQLAELFQKSNYVVETTGSAAYLIYRVLQPGQPIILLGNRFEEKIEVADLIALLKACNRSLNIILVSDEDSLLSLRKARQEGIFYHSLKPISHADNDELRSVVECAFNRLQAT
jgi:DNA-binding NtrC family response regulator